MHKNVHWFTWWCHQMETFSALLAILCEEFIGLRWIPRTKASDAELWYFFDQRLNKRLSKQSWGWWFETLSCPLWHHCNEIVHKCRALSSDNHPALTRICVTSSGLDEWILIHRDYKKQTRKIHGHISKCCSLVAHDLVNYLHNFDKKYPQITTMTIFGYSIWVQSVIMFYFRRILNTILDCVTKPDCTTLIVYTLYDL